MIRNKPIGNIFFFLKKKKKSRNDCFFNFCDCIMILVIDVSNCRARHNVISNWYLTRNNSLDWFFWGFLPYPFSNNRPKRAKYCWLNPFVWSCHQEVSLYYTDNYGIILCEIKVCFTSHSSTYRHERFILFFNRVTNNWHILDLV